MFGAWKHRHCAGCLSIHCLFLWDSRHSIPGDCHHPQSYTGPIHTTSSMDSLWPTTAFGTTPYSLGFLTAHEGNQLCVNLQQRWKVLGEQRWYRVLSARLSGWTQVGTERDRAQTSSWHWNDLLWVPCSPNSNHLCASLVLNSPLHRNLTSDF